MDDTKTLKHLTGQHNQRLHGNRGVKVSNEAISGLDKQVQSYYDGLDTKGQVQFRLAWYREKQNNPTADSFDFMQKNILKQNPGIHSNKMDTAGKNSREATDLTNTGIKTPGTKEYDDHVMALVGDHNHAVAKYGVPDDGRAYSHAGYAQPIRFQTTEQAHAWLEEFKGQLTDGKYENHRINDPDVNYVHPRNGQRSGRISPANKLAVTKIVVDPSKPPSFPRAFTVAYGKSLSFKDLTWLFDKQHGNSAFGLGQSGVRTLRDIFSNMSNAQVKTIAAEITAAIQGGTFQGSH